MPILTAADLPSTVTDAAATTSLDLAARDLQRAMASAHGRARRGAAPARRRRGRRLELVGRLRRPAPSRASRCWPTTRTWASRRRASGSRSGCAATRSPRACPYDVVGLLVRGHARRRHRPQRAPRLGPDQPRAPTSATSSWRRSRTAPRCATAARRRSPSGRRSSRSTAATDPADRSARRCTARSSPTCCDVDPVGGTLPVPEDAPGRTVRGRAGVDRAAAGPEHGGRARDGRREDADDIRAGGRAARRAVAEHRLRDDGRPHRLPGARPDPGPRERRRRAGPVGRHLAAPRLGQRYDWQGYVAPDDMPRALDPADGFIVTANKAVTPDGVGPFLTDDWDYGYRAQRIRDRIEAGRRRRARARPSTDMSADPARPAQPVRGRPGPRAARGWTSPDGVRPRRSERSCAPGTTCSPTTRPAAAYFAGGLGGRAALGVRRRPAGRLRARTAARAGSRSCATSSTSPTSPWWDDKTTRRGGRGPRRGADPRDGGRAPAADRRAGPGRDPLALGAAAHGRAGAPGRSAGRRSRIVRAGTRPVEVGGGSSIVDATAGTRAGHRTPPAWDASRRLRGRSGSPRAVDAHGRRPGRPATRRRG